MTECEIFLSLIVKFLDPDKPTWQRALALEVLHKMTVQADLLTNFCECYDLKPHATNIFQDIVNSLGAYVHSLFVNPQMMSQTGVLHITTCLMCVCAIVKFIIWKVLVYFQDFFAKNIFLYFYSTHTHTHQARICI